MKQVYSIVLTLLGLAALTQCHISLETIIRKQGLKLIKGLDVGKASVEENGCQCIYEKYDCGCCAHLEIEKIGVDDTACVNVTYLPDQYGISALLTWDDKVVFNETVSARNPPPLCIGIPYVKLLDMCVAFYDLDVQNKTFHGCIKLEADVAHFDIEDYDLGCFNIPFSKKKSMQSLSEAELLKHEAAIKELIAVLKDKRAKLNRV